MNIVKRHQNSHSYFCPGINMYQIQTNAVFGIRFKSYSNNTGPLHEYLIHNWQEGEICFLWGRRSSEHGIRFTRTTMVVEAYWSVLELHDLVMDNRRRIYFIIHLIQTTPLQKFRNDCVLLSVGVKISGCEQSKQTGQVCHSCPAFLNSRFIICKHLLQQTPCSLYRYVMRSSHPPFPRFERTEGRRYA